MDLYQTEFDNSFKRESERLGTLKRGWVIRGYWPEGWTRRGEIKSLIIVKIRSWGDKIVYSRETCFRYKIQRVNCKDFECVLYCEENWRLRTQ